MNDEFEHVDWNLCTPEGQDLEQLRRWAALPLLVKLRALEEMCDQARAVITWRQARGLPYFDPYTGELVKGGESQSARPT